MIYWELFIPFLRIGAFSFGGGYGMISLMREEALAHGWLGEEALLDVIAVAESTPGPIAVNMATFVGASQGGALGSLVATLGVVLPSFALILVIAALIRNLLHFAGVKAFLSGVRPCVVGLILATAATMLLGTVFGITGDSLSPCVDYKGLIILALLFGVAFACKKWLKRKPSPILVIFLSAGLGMLFYGL